jgi:hypothetical protein
MELPSYRWRLVHLAALWGYGVSQPVFSMLKGNPELLYLRGSTRTDAIVFSVLLAFVPPLLVLAVEALAGLVSASVSGVLHIVAVWGFAFLAVLQLTRLLDIERGAALLLPMIPAALVAFLYLNLRPFRTFLSISIVLPAIAGLSFIASVPVVTEDAQAADVRVAHPVPVVLVVFDEFPVSSIMRPDGSIDAVRYPNFARLAREGTWYPHATTVHEYTTGAVPAILTGTEPKQGQLPILGDYPRNVFTLLGKDYRIHADEPVTRLCPSRYCPGEHTVQPIGVRVRELFQDVDTLYFRRVLPRDVRGQVALLNFPFDSIFSRFLAGIVPSSSRQLDVLHLSLPHAPWHTLPSGREYQDPATIDGTQDEGVWNHWTTASWRVDQSLQAHLLQVGYTDRLLGKLIGRLEAGSLYDRSLVIVTADHGASFKPGGSRRVVRSENLSDVAGVPLFVKYPRQRRGRIDGRDAKTIDIVPTIADVVGVKIPWHVDGVSLRRAPVRRSVSVSSSHGDPVVASPTAVATGVLATARRNAALFGEGADSMYRIGPYPELLDRPLSSIPRLGGPRNDVRFDDPTPFGNVQLSSGFVPARIAGTISGDAVHPGTPLAVVVDDHVRAMTRCYELDGLTRFTALVPETSFHDGENDVGIYAASHSGGVFRLSRLGGTPARADALVTAAAVSPQGAAGPRRP